MRIATWNVNSIRRRIDAVMDWLERKRPEVLCLQETRCLEDQFPANRLRSLGYTPIVVGQAGVNGVAIMAREPHCDARAHPVWPGDADARSLAATVGRVRIVNVYVPYGEAVGTARFRRKLRWLDRLETLMSEGRPGVVTGDFNVAPEDRDVYDPDGRRETLICSTPEREAFRALLETGYVDAFRKLSDDPGHYTWWSHRVDAVRRNRGLRVDHHLVHRRLSDCIQSVEIDVSERRRPGASDHAPVTLTLEL